MDIRWVGLANESFENEVAFIIEKWNTEESVAFLKLVEDFLKLLEDNPYIGKISNYKGYRQFVLSTQTNIWYQVDENLEIIFIVLFWNNRKNPNELKKLLK